MFMNYVKNTLGTSVNSKVKKKQTTPSLIYLHAITKTYKSKRPMNFEETKYMTATQFRILGYYW